MHEHTFNNKVCRLKIDFASGGCNSPNSARFFSRHLIIKISHNIMQYKDYKYIIDHIIVW